MKAQTIFRSLAFLGIVTYVLAFFANLWMFESVNQVVDEYGLFSVFPEEISLVFSLGNETFSTVGSTLVTIFTIAGLVSVCLFIIFSILSWSKVAKEKCNNIFLIVSVILMVISMLGIFIGGTLFTTLTARIQIPLTNTYYDVYMSCTINFTLLMIGALWASVFGLLSLVKRKSKQNKKED